MLLSTALLVLTSSCTPDGVDGVPATPCESGFILDGSTCVPESCGIGRWGSLPVADDTVYVDGSEPEGGDGTEATPYATIQPGLDRAGVLGGVLVAVAAGIYPETLEFSLDHADVYLAGRCRDLVTLDASVGGIAGITINTVDAAVEMAGMTLSNSSQKGLVVGSGDVVVREVAILESSYVGVAALHAKSQGMTELLMEDCLIDGSIAFGLFAQDPGTHVTLVDTTIMDTQADANGEFGRGVSVQDGAILSADGCLIDGNTGIGLYASNPDTHVTLVDTTVSDTQPDVKGESSVGIEVSDGATLSVKGCLIDRNAEYGLVAVTPGTQVAIQDTTVRDTQPDANGEGGWGVLVLDGAILSAKDSVIGGNTQQGLLAQNPDTYVTLTDTTVRDTQPDANGERGRGIEISDGATLSAEGCLIDRNSQMGLFVGDPHTQVTLRDTIVKDTQPDANGESGWGIGVHDGATLSAEGCLIEGNTEVGLVTIYPGTRVTLLDTIVKDTRPDTNGVYGRGIYVADGAALFAEDCLIVGNTQQGLIAGNPGTQVTLRDTTVKDTQPNANGEFGRGIEVSDGAVLSAEGCIIDRNTDEGMYASKPGTQVTLRDTTVKDTQPDANGKFGRGIEVQDGATLSAEGCLIDGNTEIGLFVSNSGTQVTIWNSTLSRTRTGTSLAASAAFGAVVQIGASMSASHLDVTANQGPGFLVNSDGVLDCVECTVQDNQFAGAAVLWGGTLTISDSTIEGTTSNANLLGGAGVYAWPWWGGPPTVTVTNSLIQDNPIAGVWLIGNGTYLLDGNTISGGIGEPFGSDSRCGDAILARNGVTAWNGKSGLLLKDNVFQDAEGAGVFLDDSSALMAGNSYSDNAVDLVVQNQSCDLIPDYYTEAPQRDLCPQYNYSTCYAEFFFVAMPADPVEEGAALHPRLLPMNPAASPAWPIRLLAPAPSLDHPSYPSLSR